MIKLTKGEKPKILEENSDIWTKSLLDCIAAGEKPTDSQKNKYRHKEIKSALISETNGKCAYCETKLLHAAYGDVEHIVPKSTNIEFIFDWNNLTLVCDVCNTNKGDKFPGGVGFLNPYVFDPVNHFNVIGSLIFAKPGDNNARLTEVTLKLNRAELVVRREDKIRVLREQIEAIKVAPQELQAALLEILSEEISDDKEFAAIARACIPLLSG